jgi:hypothetical protein
MSLVLTPALAERAVNLVMPAITAAMENEIFKRPQMHIVVGDPGIIVEPKFFPFGEWKKGGGILYEYLIGNPEEFEYPYIEIARSKTHLSWLHKKSTRRIQSEMPHVLRNGDTQYFGSAYKDGLAVGASGVQADFDEMVAYWVLAACSALCQNERSKGNIKNDGNFLIE